MNIQIFKGPFGVDLPVDVDKLEGWAGSQDRNSVRPVPAPKKQEATKDSRQLDHMVSIEGLDW